ncbi:MAG: dissimilatory-type sulfite reductase subunit alpha [Deltaproteobacteria bacterium]|nr:dissimilatory-type sulfite reductase subunit alpha [Deltaproteobacteria bacterium]
MAESETPLLDELEKGPWPSFVKDMKLVAEKKPATKDLLKQLERSYKDKIGHWKHGGIVGVMGYGGGVIGRYSDLPDEFPNVQSFHTLRVNHPSGWFYTTDALRKICDVWDTYGSGMTNMHGSTGDIILLGTTTENLQPCFDALSEAGFDLGGSGSALRTPSCCIGPGRCEWSCIDTLDLCNDLTQTFQNEMHRPMWPYKFKFKISGCPNDCVAAIARADLSIIGTWKDEIQIDPQAVKDYAGAGLNVQADICNQCPTNCMEWDPKSQTLKIYDEDCNRCMHCIDEMPKALRPGKERGATLLVGGKAPILEGAQLSSVIVPFMKMEPPYTELKDLIEKMWEWWDENAKMRERIGELINRFGMRKFLKEMGLQPVPQMIKTPRANPYYFWDPEDIELRQDK